MGQAFDKDGHVLGEAYGETKREVFDALIAENPDAHEIRIRSMEEKATAASGKDPLVGPAPTVGRIVHYKPLDGEMDAPPDVPCAAVVTRVHSATCVNLHLLPDGFGTVHKTSVLHGDQPGQWTWPPRA